MGSSDIETRNSSQFVAGHETTQGPKQQNGLGSGGKTVRKDGESALLVWRESSGLYCDKLCLPEVQIVDWCGCTIGASRNAWDKWGRWLTTRRAAVRKNTAKVGTKEIKDRGSTQEEGKSTNIWGNGTAEEPFA
ncbi:hypothetical protein K438DRAFT_1765872 [Mycena galopus ATCC 62051]|nr:hypothetical protein K438DRAFT_1765872 [Mycena galopus ATCC 62051]